MKSAEVRRELDCPYLGLGRENMAAVVATPVPDSNGNEAEIGRIRNMKYLHM